MCGFVCVVTRAPIGEVLDEPDFRRDILNHRGPDSSDEIVLNNAYIRHWRLSIVDLSAHSNQPYGRDGSWLIYNGEIYNHQELAHRLSIDVRSDTAFLYEVCRLGIEEEQLKKARGFFSYLYVEENGSVLSGGRDPFGKKPLFYYIDSARGIAAFASEEKAIVDCLKARDIDFTSISQYLLYKSVFHGRTYFRNIRQLAPGSRFRFDARTWSCSMEYDWSGYYQMSSADLFSTEPGELDAQRASGERLEQLAFDTLHDALIMRIPTEVPACLALSGGVDSSLLAYLVADEAVRDQFSQIVTIGFQDPGCDESLRARATAQYLSLGRKHSVVAFQNDQLLEYLKICIGFASAPLEHPHYLSYYLLCHTAAKFAKVLITGEGADELFMGYEHYSQKAGSFAFREYLARDDEYSFEQPVAAEKPFDFIREEADVQALRHTAVASRMASREYELKTHLLSLLDRNDKMGMASSVEVRAPFLDREMLGLCLSLSDGDLVTNGSPKDILKRLYLHCFPTMNAQPRKIGFRVPFDEVFACDGNENGMLDYCEVAARALREECGLRLVSVDAISPRLGWSLLNIGVFLESSGYSA